MREQAPFPAGDNDYDDYEIPSIAVQPFARLPLNATLYICPSAFRIMKRKSLAIQVCLCFNMRYSNLR